MTFPRKTVLEDVRMEEWMSTNWARDTEELTDPRTTAALACCCEEGALTVYHYLPEPAPTFGNSYSPHYCLQKSYFFFFLFTFKPSLHNEPWFLMNFPDLTSDLPNFFLETPFIWIIWNKTIHVSELFTYWLFRSCWNPLCCSVLSGRDTAPAPSLPFLWEWGNQYLSLNH